MVKKYLPIGRQTAAPRTKPIIIFRARHEIDPGTVCSFLQKTYAYKEGKG